MTLIIIGAVLVLALIFYIYEKIKQKREQKKLLLEFETMNKELEEVRQKRQKALHPKNVKMRYNDAWISANTCPECGLILRTHISHCKQCGQKLDWKEVLKYEEAE